MRHIKLFENFSLNKGPFLVMEHDLDHGESWPVRIYLNLKEASDYVLNKTLADIQIRYSGVDSWLKEKSDSAIDSLEDLLLTDHDFVNDFLYTYQILENSSSEEDIMELICTEFEILREHYLASLTPEEKREYEALGRHKKRII